MTDTSPCGSWRKRPASPSSARISNVDGWIVSPRKVTQEVGVLFRHTYVDSSAGEQQARSSGCWATAGDAAADRFIWPRSFRS
jgi:hypothetical protein